MIFHAYKNGVETSPGIFEYVRPLGVNPVRPLPAVEID